MSTQNSSNQASGAPAESSPAGSKASKAPAALSLPPVPQGRLGTYPATVKPEHPSVSAKETKAAERAQTNADKAAQRTRAKAARNAGLGTSATAKGGGASKHTKLKVSAAVAVAVVLFGGGIAAGMAIEDPTASEEYAALAAAKSDLESERDELAADYERLEGDYDELSGEMADREAAVEERTAALEKGEAELAEAEAAVVKREEAVTGAEQEKAGNTIREGTWTVGVDIAAGTYRTTDTVGSRCYWAILASGTNGDDIIANDIPGGGRPTVTLSKGQDFNTSRCGTWNKQ